VSSCRIWKKAIFGSGFNCRLRPGWCQERLRPRNCARSCFAIQKSSPRSPSTAGPTTAAMLHHSPNVELFAPLKPYDRWPAGRTKEKLIEELNKEFADEVPGATYNFSQ
jgi:hypothetical protein